MFNINLDHLVGFLYLSFKFGQFGSYSVRHKFLPFSKVTMLDINLAFFPSRVISELAAT